MTAPRRPSNRHRPGVSRPGATGLRFGMFAVCVTRDPDAGLNAGKAKPLYDLLVSYADVSSRDTSQGYPYREALATALDCSKQTVDRAADYLEKEIGLLKIHRRKVEGKPDENDANLYEIFDAWLIHGVTPPAGTPPQLVARYGHTIPGLNVGAWVSEHAPDFDLAAWEAAYDAKLRAQQAKREEQRRKERARRKRPKKGGGVMGDATPEDAGSRGGSVMGDATGGVMDDVTGGVMGDALSKAGGPEPVSPDGDAPSGRSPVDGRSPSSTGSRGAREEGGCAASSNNQPAPAPHTPRQRPSKSSSKAKHTRQQLDRVRAVRALYPPDLLHGWTSPDGSVSYEPLPDVPTLSQAILDALAGDVPAADRTVEQLGARIAQRWRDHGWADKFYAGAVTSLVGVAIDMVRPLKGSDRYGCANPRCDAGRDVDTGEPCMVCPERIAARKAARRQAAEPGAAPAAGAAAGRGLAVPGPREHRPFRECPCREPIPKDSEDTLCPACRRDADEAERDRQLRERLARQYGTPEQVAAYCGEPPF